MKSMGREDGRFIFVCKQGLREKNTRNSKNLTLLKKNHVPGTSLKIKVVIKLSKLACVLANFGKEN